MACQGISYQISLWVSFTGENLALRFTETPTGPPILACVHKSIPDIFMDCHMMVAEPEKVRAPWSSKQST